MYVVKIKLIFGYSTLYLLKIFTILNYNYLKKVKIYLFTFRIVRDIVMRRNIKWDEFRTDFCSPKI